MNKFLSTVLLFFLCTVIAFGQQSDSLRVFKRGLDVGLEQSKQQKKPILLYYTALWCGPCLKMQKYVFTDPDVYRFINNEFIFIKVDADSPAGKKLLKRYPAGGYPSFTIINTDAGERFHFLGYRNAPEFIKTLKDGLQPEKMAVNISRKKFEKGERDVTFLREYLVQLQEIHLDKEEREVYDLLFKRSSIEQLKDTYMWGNYQKYINNDSTKNDYIFLKKNASYFMDKYGNEAYQRLVLRPKFVDLETSISNIDSKLFEKTISNLKAMNLSFLERDLFDYESIFLITKKKYTEYIRLIESETYPLAFPSKSQRLIAASGQIVLSKCDDLNTLKNVLRWLSEVDVSAINLYCYIYQGELEERLGNYTTALKNYQKALTRYIDENPNSKNEPTGIYNLIDRVKKKMPN